jgi:hypothetical protein
MYLGQGVTFCTITTICTHRLHQERECPMRVTIRQHRHPPALSLLRAFRRLTTRLSIPTDPLKVPTICHRGKRFSGVPGTVGYCSIYWKLSDLCSGFGGLGVSMLASGTQDRGFKPGRSRRVFSGVIILSMHSFGREVKQFVPCRRFAARDVEVESLRPNYSDISCSKFPPSLTAGSSDRVGSGLSVKVPLHSSSVGALWS